MDLFKSAPLGKDRLPGQNEVDQKPRHITDHNGDIVGYAQIDQHGVDDIIHCRRDGAYDEKLPYSFGQTTAPQNEAPHHLDR